jgi:hypothetical protein
MAIVQPRHVARVVACKKSRYGHFFGGEALHEGARFKGAKTPLHLVYCFNLSDPALDAIKRPKGLKWFPLYHGFQFDGCRFGYLVESEDRIRVFSGPQKFAADFPYDDYPEVFPRVPVRAELLGYEAQKTLTLANLLVSSGDEDLRGVSKRDRDRLWSWHYPFTQVGGFHRFIQGPPGTHCPNPSCRFHGQTMEVLATVWNEPVPGVNLWIEEGGDYVELVYEQCDTCGTVWVSNQCD